MEESDHAFLTLASTAAAKNPITTAKAIKEELIQRYMEAWMSKATIVNRRLAVFFSYGLNVVDGIRIKPSEKGLAIYHGDGKYLYIPAAGDREIVDCALQAWAPIVNALLQTPGSVAELHRVIDEEIEKEGWQIFLRDGQALDTMKFQGKVSSLCQPVRPAIALTSHEIELCAQGRMARKQLNALKLKDPNIPEHIYDPQSDTFKVAYYSITIHGDLDLTWHTFSWQTSPMEFRDYFPRLEDPKYCKRALANAGRRLMRLRDRQGMSSVVATLTQELDLEIERAKPKNSMIPLHVEVPFLRSWCDSDTPSVVSETPSVSSEGWLPMPSPDNFMAMVEGIRMVHKWPLIVVVSVYIGKAIFQAASSTSC